MLNRNKDEKLELVTAIFREAIEGIQREESPRPPDPFNKEWDTYKSQVVKWLIAGHEGQYVLITKADVLGFFDTPEAARAEGSTRGLPEPFFVHPVRLDDLRLRGINWPMPCRI